MGRKKNPLSAFTDAEIFHEAAKRMRARQAEPPRARVLRPCPKCGKPFGARELRIHKPKCVVTAQRSKTARSARSGLAAGSSKKSGSNP